MAKVIIDLPKCHECGKNLILCGEQSWGLCKNHFERTCSLCKWIGYDQKFKYCPEHGIRLTMSEAERVTWKHEMKRY